VNIALVGWGTSHVCLTVQTKPWVGLCPLLLFEELMHVKLRCLVLKASRNHKDSKQIESSRFVFQFVTLSSNSIFSTNAVFMHLFMERSPLSVQDGSPSCQYPS
jgi:hypothetical protein